MPRQKSEVTFSKPAYRVLLDGIKRRIRSAQYEALKAVNRQLVGLYWDIGRVIIGRQKGNSWGKAVVEKLARDLHIEFPGIKGFSASNLWRMRSFDERYRANTKLAPLVREISWSHNLIIMGNARGTGRADGGTG